MFSETRYALNGDLRVAYRASPPGARDIVFVPNWFFCCEVLPELPSIQGWVEAMTSLGRLIFFDQATSALDNESERAVLDSPHEMQDVRIPGDSVAQAEIGPHLETCHRRARCP